MSNWIVGIVSGLLGLLGLFLASRAVDDGMYVFGFALLVFGVFMVFWLIKHAFDAAAVGAADAEGTRSTTSAVAAE
jgi:hypothetical protein